MADNPDQTTSTSQKPTHGPLINVAGTWGQWLSASNLESADTVCRNSMGVCSCPTGWELFLDASCVIADELRFMVEALLTRIVLESLSQGDKLFP